MKHSFILILILLSFVASAQYSSLFQSVNLNFSYPMYFITDSEESLMKDKWELKNGFNNISLGIGFSKYIKRTSIEIGTTWFTKNYKKKYVPEYAALTGFLQKEYSLKYFSFPDITFKKGLYSDSLHLISIILGVSLLHPYKFSEKVHETDGDIYKQNLEIQFLKPCKFLIGIEYKKRITAKSFIRLYSQFEYKTNVDYEIISYISNGRKVTTGKLTDDRLLLNFGVSFEYLFVKQPWKY